MPRYLLLIHEPRGQRARRSDAQGRAVFQQMLDFGAKLERRGQLRAMESLRPDRTARWVRPQDDRTRPIDGPFTEAREMIGGFVLLDCDDFEQAVEIAAQCPAAAWATIEVRETGPCHEA